MKSAIRVWDAPTRLFHWLMVFCFAGLIISGNVGGNAMEWHFRFGYAMATLIIFRLIWGFVGGYWSRFANFIFSPNQVIAYLQGKPTAPVVAGHNPLGALSVFGMLFFVVAQISSGLMSDDEIASTGPLVQHVSSTIVGFATWYHKDIGKLILLGLVVLHLAAIVFYATAKKENLVKPMIQGDKSIDFHSESSSDTVFDRVKGLLVFLLSVSVVVAFVRWAS